jgi:hypothetical protein
MQARVASAAGAGRAGGRGRGAARVGPASTLSR